MRFTFRGANGAVCCSSTNPEYLCDTCKARARAQASPVRKTASEWNRHFSQMLGIGSIVMETPNGYRAALDAAPTPASVDDEPGYDPFGKPPDGYRIALARKEAR